MWTITKQKYWHISQSYGESRKQMQMATYRNEEEAPINKDLQKDDDDEGAFW